MRDHVLDEHHVGVVVFPGAGLRGRRRRRALTDCSDPSHRRYSLLGSPALSTPAPITIARFRFTFAILSSSPLPIPPTGIDWQPCRPRADTTDRRKIILAIGGMTCASCAARVEKRLNQLDGVVATVNFATEQAAVDFPAGVSPDDLVAAVEEDRLHRHAARGADDGADAHRRCRRDRAAARRRLLVSAVLTVPVVLLSMVPALQFDYWQWLSLALAAPGRRCGARGRSTGPRGPTCATARRRWTRSSRSALLAAFGWSLYALFCGDAGTPGMTMPFELTIARRRAAQHLPRGRRGGHGVHPGRPLLRGARQAPRGRRAAGAARAGRQGRRGAARRTPSVRIPIDQLAVGDLFVVRPGREDRHRRRRRGGHLGGRRVACSPASRCRSRSVPATPSSAPPSTPADGWWCAPPASAPTPSWPRWPGSSSDAQNGKAPVQRLADRISGGVRARRHRAGAATLGVLAGHRRSGRRRVHRRGRRADHRLPVRARAGHADRAAGRHRPRRAARHPHQGPEVLESTRRIDTVVLDKTGTVTTGRMTLSTSCTPPATRPAPTCCGSPAPSRTPPSTRSAGRSPRAPPRPGRCRRSTDFDNLEGLGVHGVVDGHAVARRALQLAARRVGADAARRARSAAGRRRGRRARPRSWSAGTARIRARARRRRHRQGRPRAHADRRAARPRPHAGAAHRRQRGARPTRSPPRSASTR